MNDVNSYYLIIGHNKVNLRWEIILFDLQGNLIWQDYKSVQYTAKFFGNNYFWYSTKKNVYEIYKINL